MVTTKKYYLDRNAKTTEGANTLYQIVARRAFGSVAAGERGGYVGGEKNLSHKGTCWIASTAKVYGAAKVRGSGQVTSTATVTGPTKVRGTATVSSSTSSGLYVESTNTQAAAVAPLGGPEPHQYNY